MAVMIVKTVQVVAALLLVAVATVGVMIVLEIFVRGLKKGDKK